MEVLLGPKPKRKATDMEEDAELEEIFEGDTGRHGPHIQLQQTNSVVWFWVLKGGTYKWRKQFIHSALQEVFLSDARTAKMGMVRVL